MPRPNQPRTTGAEENLRANVRRLLDEQERSAAWLARHMTESGCSIAATGVWKILKEGRRVTVDEGLAIADALGTTLGALVEAP